MRSLILPALALLAAAVLSACSGGAGTRAIVEAIASGTPVTSGTSMPAASTAPAIASSTAEPTQSGPPALRSSISSSCRIVGGNAEIRVEYSVSALGSTQLSRVRLLQDGAEVEDSGPLEQRQFRRIATFKVEPGVRRTYRVAAEAPGATAGNVQSTVQCGTTASPTPGPRASHPPAPRSQSA